MLKNQPWQDLNHWLGIINWVKKGGASEDLRNPPNFEMAQEVKRRTNLPMIIDPSHMGGTVEKVIKLVKESKKYNFDGFIIEVRPNPNKAKTDKNQQLSWGQFKLLNLNNTKRDRISEPNLTTAQVNL